MQTFFHFSMFSLGSHGVREKTTGRRLAETGPRTRVQGYDSIVFNPGDGNEIVIYDKHRVKSMRGSA